MVHKMTPDLSATPWPSQPVGREVCEPIARLQKGEETAKIGPETCVPPTPPPHRKAHFPPRSSNKQPTMNNLQNHPGNQSVNKTASFWPFLGQKWAVLPLFWAVLNGKVWPLLPLLDTQPPHFADSRTHPSPRILRFFSSSAPPPEKSSKARSVTRIIRSLINFAPSAAPSSGCLMQHSHSSTAQPG